MSDPSAFDLSRLLAQQAWVEGLARGLVRDSSLAQDLAQEAWLRSAGAGPEPPARGFLAGVVRNLQRSHWRADSRRARREAAAARQEALPSAAELVERAELQRLLVESVLALDEHERTAILLRYFEGLTAEEIARRSRVPAGTVRARLARGLERLRARLEARLGHDDLLAGVLLVARVSSPAAPLPGAPLEVLPWIGGWLAMKTWTMLVAGAALLLSLAAGLWFVMRDEGAGRAGALGEAPLTEAQGLLAAQAPLAATAPSADARRAQPAASAGRASEAQASTAVATARVLARVVDAQGVPLVGVGVHHLERPVGASEAGGRIELELAAAHGDFPQRVEFRHPGYARERRHVRLLADTEVHLGEIVLARALTLRGRVEDEHGVPLAGAHLLTTGLENPRTDPEELRRFGPLEEERSVTGVSGVDGRFELPDVPFGPLRLWGGAEERAWSSLGPLEGSARGLEEVVLVLHPLAPTDHIRGRVLDPEGRPVPGARVYTWFMAATYGSGGLVEADAEGAFEVLLRQRVAHDLTLEDPEGRWSEVYFPAVEPGTQDLVLAFEPARWIDVRVGDADGTPLEDFVLALENASSGNGRRMSAAREPLEPPQSGHTRLRVPNAAFRVLASAHGRAQELRGPFEPDAPPERLDFALEALPGIRGRVTTAAGAPAIDAEVGLYRQVSENLEVEQNGFRLTTEAWTEARARTDSEGLFVLYPPALQVGRYESGLFVLRAVAPGHAPTELAARAYDPRVGVELELRLGLGGAIEGQATTARGVDPSGFLLAFSRGDGDVRTLRLGPDGGYRLAGLTPGPWEVRVLDDDMVGNRSSSSSTLHEDGAPPFEGWSCSVFEGQTTRHDLDLRDRAPCELRGELRLEGRTLEGWSASLERFEIEEVAASVPLDARGRFTLLAPRGGRYGLVLRGPEDASGRLELREALTLAPGEATWSLNLRPGRLEGAGALGRGTRERFYVYEWLGEVPGRAVEVTVRLVPDAAGRFVLPTVPEGPGRVARNEPLAEAQDFAPWEVLSEFVVAPGGTHQVLLP